MLGLHFAGLSWVRYALQFPYLEPGTFSETFDEHKHQNAC